MMTLKNKTINQYQAFSLFIILTSAVMLTGCTSTTSNSNGEQSQSPVSVPNTGVYDNYMQEINSLPNAYVTLRPYGNYQTADVDYWGFTKAKERLNTQIVANTALNTTQKAGLFQALQNKTGGDCDAIASPINARTDNALDHPTCEMFNDNEFVRLFIVKRGSSKLGGFASACSHGEGEQVRRVRQPPARHPSPPGGLLAGRPG